MIFLHTELFLGPARCVDSAPFFPSSITPRDDEVAKLAKEREESKVLQ